MSLRSEKYPNTTTEQEFNGCRAAVFSILAVATALTVWENTQPAKAQVATVTAPVRNVGNCQQNPATPKLICQ